MWKFLNLEVNTSNLKHIVFELFEENVIRGKGLLCRSIMKAQLASPQFTPVYAASIGKLSILRLNVFLSNY